MAADDNIGKLLELFQKCKENGEKASLFMETMNGRETTITFSINLPAGALPAQRNSVPRRQRWKTPSQLRRDKERKDKFLAKKLEEESKDEEPIAKAMEEKVILVEPTDEIELEVERICEKLLIIPKEVIDNHNIGIEYDVKDKLEARGIKVKKVKVERLGNPVRGEYVRSEVWIEPTDAKLIEKENFGIEKSWVLPCV
jgi:hypothetical protein